MNIPRPDLSGALRRGRAAKASLEELENQYTNAQADTEVFNTDLQTGGGWASLLQPVKEMVQSSQGRASARDVRPRLEKARQAVAAEEAESQVLKNALERRDKDQNYDYKKFLMRNQRDSGQGTYVSPDGKTEVATYEDINGVLRIQGTDEEVPVGYTEKERVYGAGGSGGAGKAMTGAIKTKFTDQANQVRNVGDIVNSYSDAYAKPIGWDTKFLNALGTELAGNDLLKYIGPDVDEDAKVAMRWWAKWRMNFTLEARNERFGATLTPNEQKAWEEAESVTPGMDPAEIQRRINRLYAETERAFREKAEAFRTTPVAADQAFHDKNMSNLGYDYDSEGGTYSFGSKGTNYQPFTEEQAARLAELEAEAKASGEGNVD